MPLTSRTLPLTEWAKIATLPPFAAGDLPDPTHWRIVVVERDGQVIACSSLFDTVHWDLFWIDEASRGNPAVVKQLLEAGLAVMQEYGITVVHTTVQDSHPELGVLLERLGFTKAPGTLYYLSLPLVKG